VFFEMNGLPRFVKVTDRSVAKKKVEREKAKEGTPGSIGAPMPGVVVDVKTATGKEVKKGDPLVVLSAMKMETVVAAPLPGTIKKVTVKQGDDVKAGDLLIEIDPK
jgi:pyruvate carboxylase